MRKALPFVACIVLLVGASGCHALRRGAWKPLPNTLHSLDMGLLPHGTYAARITMADGSQVVRTVGRW